MTSLPRIALILSGVVAAFPALSADAFADFSTTSNPNGAWAYGQLTALSAPFSLNSTAISFAGDGMQGWGTAETFPFVVANMTSANVVDGGTTYLPGLLALHPSSGGVYSAVRWTAGASGAFSLVATFADVANEAPATVDVHVLLNGASLFDGTLSEVSQSQGYASSLQLVAGDVLTFAVGFGDNRNYVSDHTSLSASVQAIPEPQTWALMLAGLALVPVAARRSGARA